MHCFLLFSPGRSQKLGFCMILSKFWVECSICCWIFRHAFYPAPPKKSEQIRESLKPRITHNSRQIQMTPYRLHGAPRPSRFPHRPGQNKLRIHQSFHKLIPSWKIWRSLIMQSVLTFGILWLFRTNHHKLDPAYKQKHMNSSALPTSFHQANLQHTRCTESFSLRSMIYG